jgi:inosose dehydratase
MPGTAAPADVLALLRNTCGACGACALQGRAPAVIAQARNDGWSFLTGVLNGTFTVPGDGVIDYLAVLTTLHSGRL